MTDYISKRDISHVKYYKIRGLLTLTVTDSFRADTNTGVARSRPSEERGSAAGVGEVLALSSFVAVYDHPSGVAPVSRELVLVDSDLRNAIIKSGRMWEHINFYRITWREL